MTTIVNMINWLVASVQAVLFGVLAINTVGVILAAAGFGLLFAGLWLLAIPVGGLGLYIMLKTDDIV